MIEVYLNDMRFPVVPPSVGKTINADISTSSIVKKGKINIYNGSEPDSISLASFFPSLDSTYDFIDVKGRDPYSYVNMLEKWCKTGERLRYIVTGTPINIQVKISHFEYKENDGSGDVYYILELKEDEDIEVNNFQPRVSSSKIGSSIVVNNKRKNGTIPTVNKSRKTHIVSKGEYLYSIAKKYYGDGKKYKNIVSHNINKYPSLKKSNIIKAGWKLVIP